MATNNLATILEQVKVTSNQLAASCGLNKSTVKSVVMRKRTVAPSTQERMIKALNGLSKKSFTVEEIFPAKVKRF